MSLKVAGIFILPIALLASGVPSKKTRAPIKTPTPTSLPTPTAEPQTIHGIPWEASEARAHELQPALACFYNPTAQRDLYERVCEAPFEIGSVRVVAQFAFHNDELVQVTWSKYDRFKAGELKEILDHEYGPGKSVPSKDRSAA